MVRDFYIQVDKIKLLYESIFKCIQQLNSAVLVPGTGVIKCLEMYYEKLDVVLKTKDDLMKQVMEAIKTANMLRQDVCSPFGLSFIFKEWQYILRCPTCKIETEDVPADVPCRELDNKCVIYPQLTFPISKDKYTLWVKDQFGKDDQAAKDAAATYLEESKKKETISSAISSLKEAVAAVDPKERCK
jgi:hypothetical protein